MTKMACVLGVGQLITREHCRTPSLQEYVSKIPAAGLGVPIEVNAITHKHTTFVKVLQKTQNQVVGSLAKRAMLLFCTLFGLELTMKAIAVVVLELSRVGMADVEVTTQQTKRAPLLRQGNSRELR